MHVLPELHGFDEHGLVIWFVFIKISHLKPVKPVWVEYEISLMLENVGLFMC